MTFQSGVGGYTSTADGHITNQEGGNGSTNFTDPQGAIWKISGTGGYEAESLIRFSNLSVPAGNVVTSATLTLSFEDYSGGNILRGYYVKNAWSPPPSALGWISRDTGLTWNAPGAKGSGSDISASPAFSDTAWTGLGDQTKTYTLDTATVQAWLDTPSTNLGVILVNNEVSDKLLRVYTSESTTSAKRPILTVNYAPSGGGGGGGGGGTGCTTSGTNEWNGAAFTPQSTTFTADYDATPGASAIDAVVGMSSAAATSFAGLATITRFSPTGVIDARNGGSYTAGATIAYTGGTAYHFRVPVDVGAHTYSVYVTPAGGAEQLLANGFGFRTEQASVGQLDHWAATTDTASASVAVCNFHVTTQGSQPPPPPTGSHPRIWLDTPTLTALRQRAQAGDPLWTALRNKCNSYTDVLEPALVDDPNNPHCVTYPTVPSDPRACHSEDYCNNPQICSGYQGGPSGSINDYYTSVVNLGLCYQIGLGIADPSTTAWANKGVAVLDKMTHLLYYGGDAGFAIRNFGVGMAIGYDWLAPYAGFSQTAKNAVAASVNGWLSWYENAAPIVNFRDTPISNYFSGYYAAQAYGGLALDGDYQTGTDTWNLFYNTTHRGGANSLGTHRGVAEYMQLYDNGGVEAQGWQYGDGHARGMLLPTLAALTAKGINLVTDAEHTGTDHKPFAYALNHPKALLHSTWPSGKYMDDRDNIHGFNSAPGTEEFNCPGFDKTPVSAVLSGQAVLQRFAPNDQFTRQFHNFAAFARTLNTDSRVATSAWMDFLLWNPSAPDETYTTLPRSYLATNYAMMRTKWSTTGTFGSIRALPHMDYNQGHQFGDAGSVAITRGDPAAAGGDVPFVVNPAFVARCYPGLSANNEPEPLTRATNQVFNVFYNNTTNGQYFQDAGWADQPTMATDMGIKQLADGNGYVYTRADRLEQAYPSSHGITAWTREVVFLRSASPSSTWPGVFVVYDRTTASSGGDPHMNWHTSPTPVSVSAPSSTARRWDVTDGGFKGSIITLLPQNVPVNPPVDVLASKLFRVEVRPPSPATSLRWLTVLDPATSAAGVAASVEVSSPSSNVKGTYLPTSDGHKVVVFASGAAAGDPIAGAVTFTEPAANTAVVIADLAPSTSFSVQAAVSGANHNVTVTPATGTGTFQTNSSGVLYVNISAAGAVSIGQ